MSRIRNHWLQAIGSKFWLPLPLMTLLLWFGCSAAADQVLSRPRDAKDKLQADAQLDIRMSVDVMRIEAMIDRSDPSVQMARVEVQTAESILKKLEFEFPITDIAEVEGAIAQTLELSQSEVRGLIRYEIVD